MKIKEIAFYLGLGVFMAIFLAGFVILPLADSSTHVYTVLSGSMEPALKVGDVVFVRHISPANVHQGDVITFKRDTHTVTHRCIEIIHKPNGKRLFQVKGDANEDPDTELVPEENLIGKVPSATLLGHTFYLKIPRLGYLSSFLHTFWGYILLIVIPALSLIGLETYNILLQFFNGETPKHQT